jgi:SAM-dependent methyltransferase
MKLINYLFISFLVLGGMQLNAQQLVLDVPYVPTPQEVVDGMLELADVKKGEVVYDLGCGDGRIVITAAKKFGATGIGVDLNPERIEEANANAVEAKVTDKVTFHEGDLFNFDFSKADVLTLYLLPDVNLKLKPKILAEMKPGSRVVSHAFNMGDWEPDKSTTIDGRNVYLWIIPEKK